MKMKRLFYPSLAHLAARLDSPFISADCIKDMHIYKMYNFNLFSIRLYRVGSTRGDEGATTIAYSYVLELIL